MMKKRHFALFSIFLVLPFVACDFQGPWSYYPEEREIYQGVFTFGYIEDGKQPVVCLNKLYALDEASAENFAFYDSAVVRVSGKFKSGQSEIELEPMLTDPNCFSTSEDFLGIKGEEYALSVTLEWDSAGKNVTSEYSATATIPEKFDLKGVNVPVGKNKYEWHPKDGKPLVAKFLDYPLDMEIYKFAMEFDSKVGGVIMTMDYDNVNGGESMKTTINHMMSAFIDPDSMGFYGTSMKEPHETSTNLGFSQNMSLGGVNQLDSLMVPNFSFPIGKNVLHFYATDWAYYDYENYVIASFEDPRVVPRSNIENGMGVWTGLNHIEMEVEMQADEYVKYTYMAVASCDLETMETLPWDTRACRLYQNVYCAGLQLTDSTQDLIEMNRNAYKEYASDSIVAEQVICYAPAIVAAMQLETPEWSAYLPDSITEDQKMDAYVDAVKRYCVASNFKSNSTVECEWEYESCQVESELTACKFYLWQWCSDRGWNLKDLPQCGPALVSRYRLEKQKSSTLKKQVEAWCSAHKEEEQCKLL